MLLNQLNGIIFHSLRYTLNKGVGIMEENEKISASGIAGIIIAEAAAVLIFLLTLTVLKYFFKDYYAEVKKWYGASLCAETDIKEVIETAGGDIVEI